MNDSNNLGHDPRHINKDSIRAHWRIRMRGILLVIAVIAAIIAVFFLFSCSSNVYRKEGVVPKTWSYTISVGDNVERIESEWVDISEASIPAPLLHDSIPPIFEFNSVSQFLVFADTIEEYHQSQRIIGIKDRIVLTTTCESGAPAFFPITTWTHLNDSTILGWSEFCSAEYQRRWGKSAVRVDFVDPEKGKSYFLAFEFWCDTTNVR